MAGIKALIDKTIATIEEDEDVSGWFNVYDGEGVFLFSFVEGELADEDGKALEIDI